METKYVILILLMGLVTYLTRVSFFLLSRKVKLPDLVFRSLKYILVAILATIIFPGIFVPNKELDIAITNPYIWAALITAGTLIISKNSLAGIVLGIASLVVLRTVI